MRRTWLVLLCALLAAWPAVATLGASAAPAGTVRPAADPPSVDAAMPGGSDALRGGEGPGGLRLHERVRPVELPGTHRVTTPLVLSPGASRAGPPSADRRDARDVVHSRRAVGAHLLHFATPPPAGR